MSLFHKEFDEVPIEIFSALQKAREADKSLVEGVGLMLTYDFHTKRYVACDNRYDEFFIEDFDSYVEAYLWLMEITKEN